VSNAVKAPRPAPEEITPLNQEQAKALLGAAHEDRFEALYVLAVTTGLRQGELLGLKWEDVYLEDAVFRVRRTLTRHKGRLLFSEPKTKRSRRTVQLTDTAVEALRAHLTRQMEEMRRLGDLYRDQALVFATEKGTPVNPSNLRERSFAPLLKRAGLSPIRFHDLRHTCATLLLSRNVNPKIVSEMLGHATIAITLDMRLDPPDVTSQFGRFVSDAQFVLPSPRSTRVAAPARSRCCNARHTAEKLASTPAAFKASARLSTDQPGQSELSKILSTAVRTWAGRAM
jgi:integrase